ncbi:hypothetical protein B296_00030460 [Ensete ventricosum]|uniref:Uncharacterized protein n=1 Tax=Ensete ventricosum TaxID=4639 RepID=A0A426Y215_ENSVE|nr:hypothetical protein B296_00030460 [Ensete ventricosum]
MLAGDYRPCGLAQSAVPAGGCRPFRAGSGNTWLRPGRALPALHRAGRPSSSLPSLRKRNKNIRMEKMKEAKRPPL